MREFFRDKVGDDPRYRIRPAGDSTVHYPCGGGAPHNLRPINPRDELRIVFMPEARAESLHALTWEVLAQAMVDWVNAIAQNTWQYDRPFPVVVNSQRVALIGAVVMPDQETGSNATT